MKVLELSQVGRYHYDPKRPAPIPQHRLELWPGYITAIQAYESKEFLLLSSTLSGFFHFMVMIQILKLFSCSFIKNCNKVF